MVTTALRREVASVVARGACSGCGLCVQLDAGLEMRLNGAGHLRPAVVGDPAEHPDARKLFESGCPGVTVSAQRAAGSHTNDLLGNYLEAWEAWSATPDARHAGSSGGVLTALNVWLLETGRATRVLGAAADAANPRRTVPVTILTRDQALAAAGSRYAPVATLSNPDVRLAGSAVTAKPCEAAALRSVSSSLSGDEPLLLSFFCAGTPSQFATDRLLSELGVEPDADVEALRYRGNGWPGEFSARSGDSVVTTDYDSSWGRVLGPTTQWRCKVCPDGVGESADIVAADSWATDERGYPVFTEGAGVSALIVRTERGREAVLAAIDAGVIEVRPLRMPQLEAAQPLQVTRRTLLWARLWGSHLAGRRPPRFRGFRLVRLGARRPRQLWQTLKGTYRRVRSSRGDV